MGESDGSTGGWASETVVRTAAGGSGVAVGSTAVSRGSGDFRGLRREGAFTELVVLDDQRAIVGEASASLDHRLGSKNREVLSEIIEGWKGRI